MKLGRALTYAAVVYLTWLAMQAVHELGHILAAWLTGGTVERVILEPFAISRTDVSPNLSPLAVAWAGPLVGVALPLLIATACRWRFRPHRFSAAIADAAQVPLRRVVDPRPLADFFAGFCLIANGAYIGIGSFDRIGDAGDLLRHGSSQWLLVVFGITAISCGLLMWHLALQRHRK
ncbi:M50 family metallopeptidase [Lacipirellula limnantheis]|uniref:Peptidase family M50 n=1 Tax=Lacipirellula limnantheis TaxID=2528024 RepID=A0A517U3V8_9BACT|nr:M50 family metallopeptidase [Lacipirellula limnantheis]QDT75310.1 hypothetical protein I41_45200 [Lacipirellula limnantheis]